MDQVCEVLRYYHYAYRTEQTYCQWIKRFLKHYNYSRHPSEMGAVEIEEYLSYLATRGEVAAATQRQALNALVFLYRDVLDVDLGEIAPIRSKRLRKPPTVLTQGEVQQLLRSMSGTHQLMAKLLYGCGLRLMECIRLRIQSVDFGQGGAFLFEAERGIRIGRWFCRRRFGLS